MSSSAVTLLGPDQAPLLARPYYERGDPGPIVAALAQVPELLEVALPFIGTVLGPSALDWRTKELVIVRVSALMECRFCVNAHTAVALDAGLSRAEILALHGKASLDAIIDPAERAMLAWVDAVACGPGPVEPTVLAGLRPHFAEHEIVELTLLVGATLMLNRFATALRLPTDTAVLRRLETEDLLP
ncbi:MAG TPA: carboxymuconolactone decarboxylase family protein [Actinophytocola sp.]|uniref:carboxymuconolactone decarboxylase family protein n=1 Tax=Actinophytocola sp. TaxID=1872138 RepID=UPI002DFBAF05|nr:carboxymuconolactone decarboxylase family protein [Actinophytocola sp.]